MKKLKIIFYIILLIISIVVLCGIQNISLENILIKDKVLINTFVTKEKDYQGLILYANKLYPDTNSEEKIKQNTLYLQGMINQVSSSGGGIVKIPEGVYYFKPNDEIIRKNVSQYVIKCKDNVIIQGAGIEGDEATILKPYAPNNEFPVDMFYYNDYADSNFMNKTFLINADFRDFIIDGDLANAIKYNSAGKGFMINLFKDCDWENVIVKNTDGTGFGVDCPINCTIENCKAINCGKTGNESNFGASGFGIGTGFSNEEYMEISNCIAEGNMKFGFFFEHQGRFNSDKYTATTSNGFVVQNCVASGNLYDFGAARGNDVTYENCISNDSYKSELVTNKYPFYFENYSKNIHVINCKTSQQFLDVINSDEYYYVPVYWALNNGITTGTSKTKFSPDLECTKEQAIVLLYRMAQRLGNVVMNVDKQTMDVVEAANWAYEQNIIQIKPNSLQELGEELKKQLEKNCTRAEFIVMLWKYAGSQQVEYKHNFMDVPSGMYYEKALNWATSKGIVNDIEKNKFLPENECKRGEILTFLYKFSNTKNQFSINYNLNGGIVQIDNQTKYNSGKDTFTLNNPIKTGYTFKGWTGSNYVENIEQNLYIPQKKVTITTNDTGNKTYTANWRANTYIVCFDGNGGKVENNEIMEVQYFTFDDVPQKLLENKYVKRGYDFKEWNTKKDGTGESFSNGEFVRNLITEDMITLYAQWEHNTHIEVIDNAVEAICTQSGKTEGKHCEICNMVIVDQSIIPALGHKFENYESDGNATCLEDGTKTAKCERCDEVDTIVNVGSKVGHNYEETVVEPTCTEKGEKTYTCTVCGEARTVEIKQIGHNFQNGECNVCGEKEPKVEVKDTESYDVDVLKYYITKIAPETKVKDFLGNLDTNATVKAIYNGETQITNEEISVATGMQLKLKLNEEDVMFTLIVSGDVDGDGLVGFLDMIDINEYRLGKKTLTGIYKIAGNVDDTDEELDFWDILKINEFRLGKLLKKL